MSAAAKPAEKGTKGGRKPLLLVLAAVLLLAGVGAGGWFSGVIPGLLGRKDAPDQTEAAHGAPTSHEAKSADAGHGAKPAESGHGAKPADSGHGAKAADAHGAPKPAAIAGGPAFMDLPDIVANLNTGPRRAMFVKLKAKLELARPEDQSVVAAAMPRVLDLFQGYLREMRPEELRGTAGTYRLREELLARTNLATPPARVVAVLFTEMIVQ